MSDTKVDVQAVESISQERGVLYRDEIDLFALFQVFWKGKLIIIIFALLAASVSYFYASNLPNVYQSEAILSPASSSRAGGVSGLGGGLGGLASLAGIDINSSQGGDKTAIAIEWLKSWDFLEKFIFENNLEVEVYASDGWNRKSNKITIDPDVYDAEKGVWLKDENGLSYKPSGADLYEAIKPRISVEQIKKTGFVTLKVVHYSPYVAKQWLDLLVENVNKKMKDADRKEAQRSIKYLKAQVIETDITEMQTIFFQLIEEQTKTLMLAEVKQDYVFKVISPAKVDEKKVEPSRGILVIAGFLVGVFLSVLFLLIRHVIAGRR